MAGGQVDDIDLDPVERPMGDAPDLFPERPVRPPYQEQTPGIGFETFRGMLYALPVAILLWAFIGGVIYTLV